MLVETLRKVTAVAPEYGRHPALFTRILEGTDPLVLLTRLRSGPEDWYWSVAGDTLVSDPSPWIVAAAVTTETVRPDFESVADMLFYPALPSLPEKSLLREVRRLPRAGNRPPRHGIPYDIDLNHAVQRLDCAVRGVVGQAISGKRVGVLSTGGLDSALVAAVAAEVSGLPPILVAIRGGLSSPAEEQMQDVLAQWLGAELITIDRLPDFDIAPLIRRNEDSDFPSGGAFTHVWEHAVNIAFSTGVEVLLTGEGGNERFSPGALLAADLLPLHPVKSLAQIGRSRGTETTLASFIREQFNESVLPTVTPSRRRPYHRSMPLATGPGDRWLGHYVQYRQSAALRRRQQLRRLRKAGWSWTEADAAIALERHELFDAGDTKGRSVFAPLSSEVVGAAVATVHPAIRNPVGVGTQDKHLLRVLARHYLPAQLTELRKVGISNQLAVMTKSEDVRDALAPLEKGWHWMGFNIDDYFGRPHLYQPQIGLLWTRMLAFGAWALNAIEQDKA